MKIKFLLYATLLLFTTTVIMANDNYTLSYDGKTGKCLLTKNNKKINLLDKRFHKKQLNSPYTCASMQKEQYKSCKIIKQNNVTALALGYGAYKRTNFILAIQNTSKGLNASIEVECSKTKILKWVKKTH